MARKLVKKIKKTGQLYARPIAVEEKIDCALVGGFTEAIRRARIRDQTSSDFIVSECLVYLIREAKRTGKDRESETLLQLLLGRCEANLKGTIRNDGIPNPEQLRDDILQHLATKFALDAVEGSGRLDYFECRFNRAFAALRIDFYNREAALSNQTVAEISYAGDDLAGDEHANDIVDSGSWHSSSVENHLFAKQVAAFVDRLPTEERQAIILCRVWNLTQEDAAQRLGVSVKTIYNRLKRADQKLASIKEDA
jgi:RNA polymerase sigma factor (sigma-70 family)